MNNRQRMYATNTKARIYILKKMGGSDVYFKEHLRRKSKFYHNCGFYKATDFFNLFDGLCFINGNICFFQIKTDAWPSTKRIDEFLQSKNGFGVFSINVRKKRTIQNRDVRWYTYEMYCM